MSKTVEGNTVEKHKSKLRRKIQRQVNSRTIVLAIVFAFILDRGAGAAIALAFSPGESAIPPSATVECIKAVFSGVASLSQSSPWSKILGGSGLVSGSESEKLSAGRGENTAGSSTISYAMPGGTSVPEPSSLGLLVLGVGGLLLRRRR